MSETGQVTRSAADVYEEFFVPALFAAWAPRVVEAAAVASGQRVLDVGCGTGVLTRHVAEAVGPAGAAVGVDPNEAMLAVARRAAPSLEWRQGRAESLPFDDHSFDATVSQFALMFFEDRVAGIREMARVTRPGGRIAVAVWDALSRSPGYAAVAELLGALLDDRAAASLDPPFSLGDTGELRRLFAAAGLPDPEVTTVTETATFPSIRSWMHTEIRGWTLTDAITEEEFERLAAAAEVELRRFAGEDGRVRFAMPAHIVVARP